MRILVIGASRGVGLEAVRQGLARGLDIRALARSADRIGLQHPRLELFPADATDAAAVGDALRDVDAVIQAIGGQRGLRPRLAPVSLFSDSTRALLAGMAQAGARRLVAVTGFGAGDSRGRLSLPERVGHRLLLGPAYDDKDRQEVMIRGSGLDWLIVRPTILTNGPRTGRYRVLVEPPTWRMGLISRADVADFLLREAVEPSLSHATPALAY
jgi:putative NADH-flavin reductase